MLRGKKRGQILSVPKNFGQLHQFARFGFVGVITAAIYLMVGGLLSKNTSIGAVNSANIAFVVAIIINYTFHFIFTFQKQAAHLHSIPRFVATTAVGFVVNSLVVWVGTSLFEFGQGVAQIFAMLIVIASNYILFSFWVFSAANNKRKI